MTFDIVNIISRKDIQNDVTIVRYSISDTLVRNVGVKRVQRTQMGLIAARKKYGHGDNKI